MSDMDLWMVRLTDRSYEFDAASAYEALRTERDGLAAVIERVREIRVQEDDVDHDYWYSMADLNVILDAAPSDALAEVKREAAAQALDDFADYTTRPARPTDHIDSWTAAQINREARDRATAIREGRSWVR